MPAQNTLRLRAGSGELNLVKTVSDGAEKIIQRFSRPESVLYLFVSGFVKKIVPSVTMDIIPEFK